MPITFLRSNDPFPPLSHALPNGLVAVGGGLSVQRLKWAYGSGIFPWFAADDPVMWWSPDPRMVLFPKDIHVSKSMRSVLRNAGFTITADRAFAQVLYACASVPRTGQAGTWLTAPMQEAYMALYEANIAHSVEVWLGDRLVGGLYGVAAGRVFCGESMFALANNASKVALIHLAKALPLHGYTLIDCQMYTDHLARMGAIEIPRSQYLEYLPENGKVHPSGRWMDWY